MNKFRLFIFSFLLILTACSKDKNNISVIKENRQDLEMVSAYKEAYIALNEGDPYFAAKKFLEAELLFPQSEWAPRSALMASYSYYLQNYYTEALANLERFLITYPNSKDIVYAEYLIAMCFYETIEDEKRDSGPIFKAKEKFSLIVKNYPNTDFALDAEFKLELIEDILAAKEMYLGRHYLKKEKWIASINRFKNVVENYDQTIFIEEALHRLVEINYRLGLDEEAQKYASILGYNYLSSDWYEKSYKVFNKDYSAQVPKKIKKDKRGVLDKFKKLFD
ncbi:outer membrane protein assembly factor BamD [Candidatus Pelagibacter communis]|uniref:outer membrane protein assembly factor BamD n=1 Tax=Pelagibacter ubique TaxID=198252 RepID=UPI00094C6FB7|nr:outer membrane protein assembly factor BamD [Candidatus Pelagibacter ubique]